MQIYIRRKLKVRAPFWVVAENANDWTHFAYIHRKSHRLFRPIEINEKKTFFFYKAAVLYPFPVWQHYLVVREELKDVNGYHQIYYNSKGEVKSYLQSRCYEENGLSIVEGHFLFNVSFWWKPWTWLFVKIFEFRMKRVAKEDEVYIQERSMAPVDQRRSDGAATCSVDNESLFQNLHQFADELKKRTPQFDVEQSSLV